MGKRALMLDDDQLNEKFASKKQQKYFYAKCGEGKTKEQKKWCKMAKEFSDDTNFDKLPEKVVKESIEYQDITLNIVNDIINLINRTKNQKDKKHYYLPLDGETYDEKDISVSVELTLSRNENLTDEFNIDAYYIDGESVIDLYIELNPSKEPRSYNHLYYYLVEYVRHEIRHAEQELKGVFDDEDEDIQTSILGYYTKDYEVDAQTSGLNFRSFVQDKSQEDVIHSAIMNTIRRRGLSKEDAKILYDTLLKDIKEKYGDTSLSESKIVSLIKEKEKPRMTKKGLMEYIKNPKKVVKKLSKKDMIKEQYENLEVPEGFTGSELKVLIKYLVAIRNSGVINMFGAAPILNWTKSDLERWLYGQSMDLHSLEQQKEDLEYDIDNEGEDSGIYESELESVERKIQIIRYLLDNKDKIRDILIRIALTKAENSDNYSDKSIERYFGVAAKEALRVYMNIF